MGGDGLKLMRSSLSLKASEEDPGRSSSLPTPPKTWKDSIRDSRALSLLSRAGSFLPLLPSHHLRPQFLCPMPSPSSKPSSSFVDNYRGLGSDFSFSPQYSRTSFHVNLIILLHPSPGFNYRFLDIWTKS